VVPVEIALIIGAAAASGAVGTTVKALRDVIRGQAEHQHAYQLRVEVDGEAVDLHALSPDQRDQLAEELRSLEPKGSPDAEPPATSTSKDG
jgi:hypothetical protein